MSAQLAAALAALTARHAETLPLIEELVNINSFTGNVEGVELVAERLKEALAKTGMALTVTPGEGRGSHLTFSTAAASHAPAMLLVGHHDTVFPPGSFEGFTVEGDMARGPGVLDMKGGLAVIVTVLKALSDARLLDALPLRFVTVSDEEVGSQTSRGMLEALAKSARAALVFEAGRAGDAIITSRRGSGFAVVAAHGKAAHAGNALSTGRNAIWALSRFIDKAQTLTDDARGLSVSTGLVRGGTSRNTVAAEATAELDLRFSDARGEADLIAALERAATEVATNLPGTRLDVQVEVTRRPWERSAENAALCERYARCQEQAGLLSAEAPRMGGGSDANTVGSLGLPAIDGLGPRGTGFHTHGEHISIASLALKAEALLRFLLAELTP